MIEEFRIRARCAELRRFAGKNCQTVENDVASRPNAISVFFVAQAGRQLNPIQRITTRSGSRPAAARGGPVDDVLALRDGAGEIPGFTPFNVAAGACALSTPRRRGSRAPNWCTCSRIRALRMWAGWCRHRRPGRAQASPASTRRR